MADSLGTGDEFLHTHKNSINVFRMVKRSDISNENLRHLLEKKKMTKETSSLKHQLQHGFSFRRGKKVVRNFSQISTLCPPTTQQWSRLDHETPDLPDAKRSTTINQKPPPLMFWCMTSRPSEVSFETVFKSLKKPTLKPPIHSQSY